MAKVTLELEEQDARLVASSLLLAARMAQSPEGLVAVVASGSSVLNDMLRGVMTYATGAKRRSEITAEGLSQMDSHLDAMRILAATIFKQTDPHLTELADVAIAAVVRESSFRRG